MDLTDRLFSLLDLKYKDFHSKLIPEIEKDKVIGVRIPDIRKLAKEFKNTDVAEAFMHNLPHRYYEENNLHAFLICEIKDFDLCVDELNKFLPYVDNWATCDSIRPKCFLKDKEKLLSQVKVWLKSEYTFCLRFAIEMLMVHFLDDDFTDEINELLLLVKSDEYYVKMMIAWYFATALAKRRDRTLLIIENKKLPIWIHNKTIQKAIESNRISDEDKNYLRKLKIKTTV